jgi:hypothetical protein
MNRESTFRMTAGGILLTILFLIDPGTKVNAEIDRNVTLAAGRGAVTEASVNVHNALRLEVSLSLVRSGSDNIYARRKIRIELVNPSGSIVAFLEPEIGHDSNFVVNGQNGTASNPYKLTAPAALGGSSRCSDWKIRVRDIEHLVPADPDLSPSTQQITGTVKFFTFGRTTANIPAPAKFGIEQSGSEERNINVPFTGVMTIQANWDTDEFTLENFPLTFSLINTHGSVVVSDSGFSRDSIILNISPSQRMKISYNAKCADFGGSQSWKIRVQGSSKGKVKNVDLKATITDGVF